MRTKIDEWRPRRACRAGLILAADADVSGRRVVDAAPDSRVRGPDARKRRTNVPKHRPINRNMARSYNRTGAGGAAKSLISKSARILANRRRESGRKLKTAIGSCSHAQESAL